MEENKPRSSSDATAPNDKDDKLEHNKSEKDSAGEIEIEEVSDNEEWESDESAEENEKKEEEQPKMVTHPIPEQGATIKPSLSFTGHSDAVCCIDVDPLSERALTGGCDDKAIIWSLKDGMIIKTLDQNKESIAHAKYNFDGKYFATVSLDNEISIYKSENFTLIQKLSGPTDEIPFLEWHPKANLLLIGSFDGTLWMFNAITGEVLGTYAEHKGAIRAGGFTADGKLIYSVGEDMTVRTWYPLGKSSKIMQKDKPNLKILGTEINTANCHPNPAKGLIVAGTNGGSVLYCYTAIHKINAAINISESSVECIGSSPSVDIEMAGTQEGKFYLIDSTTMNVRTTILLDSGCVKIIVSKSQEVCYVSTAKGLLYRINYKKGIIEQKYIGHKDTILDFKLSLDEKWLYTASEDHQCMIFRTC